MVKVGLLGAGRYGRVYGHAISKSQLGNLELVYAPDKSGTDLGAELGVAVTSSANEIISKCDAVIIATPSHTQAGYVKACIAAGKHFMCASPIARSSDDVQSLRSALASYNGVSTADLTYRFQPEFRHLRDVVASGALGNIGTIRISQCAGFDEGIGGWRKDLAKSGGVALALLPACLDFISWAFGGVERVNVMRADNGGHASNDYLLAVARTAIGAIAHIEVSWAEAPGTQFRSYEMTGSQGLIEYDSRVEPTMIVVGKTDAATSVVDYYEGSARAATNFLDAIAGGVTPGAPLVDGLAAVELALSATQLELAKATA